MIDSQVLLPKRTVGALPIKDERGQLCGIVTDRDIVTKIIAAGLNPHETLVCSREIIQGDTY
jgi:CBS domain-containing protein